MQNTPPLKETRIIQLIDAEDQTKILLAETNIPNELIEDVCLSDDYNPDMTSDYNQKLTYFVTNIATGFLYKEVIVEDIVL